MEESEIDNLLPDEDLWRLLKWEPPHGYREPSQYADRAYPSPEWIAWAKRVVLDASAFQGIRPYDSAAKRQALAMYLCRLARVSDCIPGDRNGLQGDDLVIMAISGAAVAGIDEATKSYVVQDALEAAKADGLLSGQETDTWRPGMRSGTGMRTFYKLTLLGKRQADALDSPPAFEWNPRQAYELAHPQPKAVPPPWRPATTPEPVQGPIAPKPMETAPAPVASAPQYPAKLMSKDGNGDVNVNVHVPAAPPTVNVVIDMNRIAAAIERLAMGRATAATEGKDSGGWTASKAEMAVEQFLKARKPLYMGLLPRCLANEKDALVKFQAEFGPSAIATKVGNGLLKGTVGKTPTYVKMIKPVISGKQPEGIGLPTGDDGTLNDILANMRRQAGGE